MGGVLGKEAQYNTYTTLASYPGCVGGEEMFSPPMWPGCEANTTLDNVLFLPSTVGPNDPVLGEKTVQVSEATTTCTRQHDYCIHPCISHSGMPTG